MSRLSPSLAGSYGMGYPLRGGRAGELRRGDSVPPLRRQVLMGCIGFTFVLLVEEPRTNTKVLWSQCGTFNAITFRKNRNAAALLEGERINFLFKVL
jgi:hypothetical protein